VPVVLSSKTSKLRNLSIDLARRHAAQPQGHLPIQSNADVLLSRLSDHAPLVKPVELGAGATLKIVMSVTENGKGKRPHQAFLLLRDQDTGLETTFAFSSKESGKAKVDFVSMTLHNT
jgi:hypothetical protein